MLLAVIGAMTQVDFATLAGNREKPITYSGWVGRSQRAAYNMLENLALFAPPACWTDNPMTALGAEIFFYARLAYTFVYIIGIRYLRTAIWGVCSLALS